MILLLFSLMKKLDLLLWRSIKPYCTLGRYNFFFIFILLLWFSILISMCLVLMVMKIDF
jgi:hypothetical protein